MSTFKHEDYRQINDEHREWLSDLNFIQDEIKYFQNQIAKLKARFEDTQTVEALEEYQKSLLNRLFNIDEYRQIIYDHERQMAKTMDLASRSKVEIEEDHHTERKRIKEFLEDYDQIKQKLKDYLAHLEEKETSG